MRPPLNCHPAESKDLLFVVILSKGSASPPKSKDPFRRKNSQWHTPPLPRKFAIFNEVEGNRSKFGQAKELEVKVFINKEL